MSAERFNITERSPSASYVGVVCSEQALSLSTLFSFIEFYVKETDRFGIQNCLCSQEKKKIRNM